MPRVINKLDKTRGEVTKINGKGILLRNMMKKNQFYRDNFDVVANGVHVFQSNFATLANGYALVFIFMGNDQTNVDEMAKAMETFARTPPPVRRGVTTIIGSAPQHKPN